MSEPEDCKCPMCVMRELVEEQAKTLAWIEEENRQLKARVAELEGDDRDPDVDDSVECCPDCERPNQFGEVCGSCERERDRLFIAAQEEGPR